MLYTRAAVRTFLECMLPKVGGLWWPACDLSAQGVGMGSLGPDSFSSTRSGINELSVLQMLHQHSGFDESGPIGSQI